MKSTSPRITIYKILRVLVILGVIFLVSRWSYGLWQARAQVDAMLADVQFKQDNLSAQLHDVEQRNALLQTDIGQQDFLREKYAVHLPGERVVVLVRDDSLDVPVYQDDPAWWRRLLPW